MGPFCPPGMFSFVAHKLGSNTPQTVGNWSHNNQSKLFLMDFVFSFTFCIIKLFIFCPTTIMQPLLHLIITGQKNSEVDIIHHHYHSKMYHRAYYMPGPEISPFQKLTHFNLITTL